MQEKHVQRSEILLRETVFLIAPLMQVHAAMVGAGDPAQECHAILRRPVARPHNLPPSAW